MLLLSTIRIFGAMLGRECSVRGACVAQRTPAISGTAVLPLFRFVRIKGRCLPNAGVGASDAAAPFHLASRHSLSVPNLLSPHAFLFFFFLSPMTSVW